MPHFARHDVAADGAAGTAHNQNCDEPVLPKSQCDGEGNKNQSQSDELDERTESGGSDAGERFLQIKGCAHGHDAERRSQPGQILYGMIKDAPHGQAQHGPQKTGKYPDQNRIGDDPDRRFSHLRPIHSSPFHFVPLRRENRENDYSSRIIQRNRAQHHQRGHAGGSVKVGDQGNPQDGGAAAVADLNEFALNAPVPQQTGDGDAQQDGDQSRQKTEKHEPQIPDAAEVFAAQIVEHQCRQSHPEYKRIHFRNKSIIKYSYAHKKHPQEHE